MPVTKGNFDELRDAFNTETNRIAAKIDELNSRTDLTAAQEEEVHAGFSAIADRLRTIGADPTNPVPPVDPEPAPPVDPAARGRR